MTLSLPSFAPYPSSAWRQHLESPEWNSLQQAWIALAVAYLNLPDPEFKRKVKEDGSVVQFLSTFVQETAQAHDTSLTSPSPSLLKAVYQLLSRTLKTPVPPDSLLSFKFLADASKSFPKNRSESLVSVLFIQHESAVEASLSSLKKQLIPQLDGGIKGDLKLVERQLRRLNHLLHVSPQACMLFLAGSDFFDGLITCFKVMNPPLRSVILSTTYLCVVGLTESDPPKWAMLSDQLYSLKEAADIHKAGPQNANDSLVPELVTNTPLLKILLQRAETAEAATDSLRKRITVLETLKMGVMIRPKRLLRRRIDKGKGRQTAADAGTEMHIHKMSKISQVQDLFPDLGAGFVAKCLDEYSDDVEQVVAGLLSESLPAHLASADRGEQLSVTRSERTDLPRTDNPRPSLQQHHADLAPLSTPPSFPTRRNIFDDDDFDRLAHDTNKISFGKKPGKSADALLQESTSAPAKAAILSALAVFDADDDERDDTYDAADVGGTVEASNQEADGVADGNEETLFRAYQMDTRTFARDAETRRGTTRKRLRDETGMADEAIEGWAVMLARNPQQQRRLEAKYAFSGQQPQLERTSWRNSPAASGAEDSDANNSSGSGPAGRARGSARGGGRGRGRGGRGGNVAGPTGERETEQARRRKEENKGTSANHNRRAQRAKKMARGGFPG